MGQWSITTPPAAYPITVAQAAFQCSVDDTATWTDWLTEAIADATAYAENACQLSLITRTITAVYYPESGNVPLEGLPIPPYTRLPLYRPPLQSVVSVQDYAGNDATYKIWHVGNTDYVQLYQSTVAPVSIVYTAGYGDSADDVPADIRRAILAHVAHMYRYREADDQSIPTGLDYIYSRYNTALA
ncbi:MAG: hypothetical protein BIFFINMI_03574 [Phycisphaerae bacterium]|nr:hypothetical protein [Phycisphaerae bacterium]